MTESRVYLDEIQLFNGLILKLSRPLEKIERATTELLKEAFQHGVPYFWEYEKGEHIYVPVDGGSIRVIHFKPENLIHKRPIVLVSGWGVVPSTFQDFYEVMHEKYEFYYLETREKASSKIKRFAQFTITQKAKDIGDAIKFLGLQSRDFVLMGTCWGSSVILQGLMDNSIKAPTILVFDPMYKLTYSRFFLTFIAPILPVPLLSLLRPFMKRQRVGEMQEKRQKERVDATVDNAVLWKWKRASIQCRNFMLYGNLHKIAQEVFVINSTKDYIHDPINYPNIAHQLPKGRFLRLQGTEDKREYIAAIVAREFSRVLKNEFPNSMEEFEVQLPRDS